MRKYAVWVRGNKEGTNIHTGDIDTAMSYAKQYAEHGGEVVIRAEKR